jgi:hypothetical protein
LTNLRKIGRIGKIMFDVLCWVEEHPIYRNYIVGPCCRLVNVNCDIPDNIRNLVKVVKINRAVRINWTDVTLNGRFSCE